MDRARGQAREFRDGLEFRKKVWFWVILAALAGAIRFGLTTGTDLFNDHFHVTDKDFIHAAGPSLAVCAMSLVGALFSFVNVFLRRPIKFDVPRSLEPWLPAVTAIAVGILIGTTIFR